MCVRRCVRVCLYVYVYLFVWGVCAYLRGDVAERHAYERLGMFCGACMR